MRVFISHQWRDKQIADRLKGWLDEIGGFDVWIDHRNLRPGDPIQESIDGVLAGTDVVLVVWSPHSAVSSGVAAEVATAERLGLRLIPCFVVYDGVGNVSPPVDGPIARYLGVDFHHFETGVASVAALLVELRHERDGGDEVERERVALLRRIREGANYLANYRDAHGVDDDRGYWVEQIVGDLEQYTDRTGDTSLAAMFAAGLDPIRTADPEAYETSMARLAPVLEGAPPPPPPPPQATPRPATTWGPPPPPSDVLDGALAASGVQVGDRAAIRAALGAYCDQAVPALHAMALAAAQSPAATQVVHHLNGYLEDGDDLIPDHHGLAGRLDDAWLVINTAFRLIESGALAMTQVPIDWSAVTTADATVRMLIPPPAMVALEQVLLQLLQVIADEIAAYQPWMTPNGHGYSPAAAWGSSWEDQMAQGMAELGVSF